MTSLNEKLDKPIQSVDSLTERLDSCEHEFDRINDRIADLETKLDENVCFYFTLMIWSTLHQLHLFCLQMTLVLVLLLHVQLN